ncbi:MAG: 5-(carboxyamino)imidazole ribonucleotide synthase [Phycisphaeraceae bacterium]|nr:MAG: 5-(carboxyamino)imidazole ribonucleotide synthase [Phycisphaeraceae bacterium]
MTLVGVLGAGQLGRMLAIAGRKLDLQFRFLDASPDAPAAEFGEMVVGAFDDPQALDRFSDGVDVVTYEFENVPVASARRLAEMVRVLPPPASLAAAQDRLEEKRLFTSLGVPTAPFEAVYDEVSLRSAAERVGLPAVLKTRRLGYDGKGQRVVREMSDLDAAWRTIGERPAILEGFVRFDRELSVIAVRGRRGEMAFYPLIENVHRDGVLRRSHAPAPDVVEGLQKDAEGHARRLCEELGHVGVLTLELFERGGALLANEMAPRVHNSGHWTIEGAATSQFENHLRAILGMELGATSTEGACVMLNLLGWVPERGVFEGMPGAPGVTLHDYGKKPAPMRKVGHVTVCGADREMVEARVDVVCERLRMAGWEE